jgi:hypothetical protein
MMLTIEMDEENGYFMLIDDGIGLAKSKSRNVLVRIRDALNAVRETSLVGLTVENTADNIPSRVNGFPRGVVLAQDAPRGLVVRLAEGKLDVWSVHTCRVVEPERPKCDTPWNDPAIGVLSAVELLQRWQALDGHLNSASAVEEICGKLTDDTRKFLEARKAAEPT